MSVKVNVEMRVSGIDDPESVEDALAGRDGYWRGELDDAIWQACREAGLAVSDTEVLRGSSRSGRARSPSGDQWLRI